jgi:hypothetical protein
MNFFLLEAIFMCTAIAYSDKGFDPQEQEMCVHIACRVEAYDKHDFSTKNPFLGNKSLEEWGVENERLMTNFCGITPKKPSNW